MDNQDTVINHSSKHPDYPVSVHYIQMSLLSMQVVRWHWHEEMEIIFVTSGEAWIKTEEANMVLSQRQAVFINRNLLHSIRRAGDQDCTLYSLRFHPSFITGSKDNFLSEKYLEPVVNSPNLKYLLLDNSNPVHSKMLEAANHIISLNLKEPFGFEIEVKGLLCCFWQLLLTHVARLEEETTVEAVSHSDSRRIKTAMRFIENHHAEPLSLEEIADSIHISKSECCRCFKRTLGLTPFEYLMRYRVFEAARKMQQKEAVAETISDLAASVGFNSPSYFNKIFKKHLHCTPLEYKRRIITTEHLTENSFLPLSKSGSGYEESSSRSLSIPVIEHKIPEMP